MAKKLSMNGRLIAAALMGALRPVLAQDAQIGDLSTVVGGVKSLKSAASRNKVVEAVNTAYGPKLAQDATLDHIPGILESLAQDEEPPKVASAEDEDDEELDEDGKPKKKAPVAAAQDDDGDKIDKPAMDAAIAKATADTVARMQAIHQAERDVEPFIGRIVVAQDSAENVYKLALDAAKIDTTGVHPSAFRAMVGMLPKPGDTPRARSTPTLAQDAAGGAGDFGAMFPNASKMKGGV